MLLVFSLLVPALLLVAVFIQRAHRNVRDAVARQMQGTARAVAALVDHEIQEADALLRTFASSQAMRDGDFAALAEMAARSLAGDRRYFVLADENYEQRINSLVPYNTRVPAIPEDQELRAAMQAGQTYLSNVMHGPVPQALVVRISRPVFAEGKLKYTLHLTTQVKQLADALALHRYASGGLISLVDRHGRIAARTRDPALFVGEYASPEIQEFYRSNPEGVRDTVTLDGVESLTAFHRAAASGWTAIIAAPKDEILGSARELLWVGLGLSAFLVLFAGTVATWIARGLARGVDALVTSAEAITRGEPVAFHATGIRETDVVAAAISRSAQHQLQISEQIKNALTQEQAARTKAQHAADRLAFSLAALDLGEWEWDPATDEMRFSTRTATMFSLDRHLSYTREEMNQRLHPEDLGTDRAVFRDAVAAAVQYHHEFRIKHPVLGERWIAAWGQPVVDAEGKVRKMMGVVQDVTERRQAELMLRTQNELLEQRVAERTRRLQEVSDRKR